MKNYSRTIFSLIAFMLMSVTACGNKNASELTSSTSEESLSSEESSEESTINWDDYTFETYSNPVNLCNYKSTSKYTAEFADPSVVRGDDGKLYAFATDRRTAVSEDGCNWNMIGHTIIGFCEWHKTEARYMNNPLTVYMWAPDVIKIGDNWIYYYSVATTEYSIGIGYGVSDTCAGPYHDMGKLFSSDELGINNSIDSHVIIDEDGVHMTVGSFRGNYVFDLEDDGMSLKGGVEETKKNMKLICGTDIKVDLTTYEGGYIIHKDGYYYYFGSSGTCCNKADSSYTVMVTRSESVYGPYVDRKGRPLTNCHSGNAIGEMVVWASMSKRDTFAGPGHNSIYLDDAGQYWIYYHCYSMLDRFATRHLFMDKLVWDDEGWPYVEGKNPSFQEELDGPAFYIGE